MGGSIEWSTRTRRQEDRFPLRGAACVADPDGDVRAAIGDALRRMGFAAHETPSAAAASFIVANINLEVLVMNAMLPDGNALKLIRQFRRAHPDLVIVALAPSVRSVAPVFDELAHFAGADAVLGAPACIETLCETVAQHAPTHNHSPHEAAAPQVPPVTVQAAGGG